jgi:hypothetical protein
MSNSPYRLDGLTVTVKFERTSYIGFVDVQNTDSATLVGVIKGVFMLKS